MKKYLYLYLVDLLWLIISFVLHVILCVKVLHLSLPAGNRSVQYAAMPLWAQISTIVVGLLLGTIIGRRWWQIVYVEHRQWKHWLNKISEQ